MRTTPDLRSKMILMFITGLVIIGNIILWTLPTENGKSLANDNIIKPVS